MEFFLKTITLVSLIILTLFYLIDFVSVEKKARTRLRLFYHLHIVSFTSLIVHLLILHRSSFFSSVSDFILLLSWGIVLVFFILEYKYGEKSLGAFTMPIPMLAFIVATLSPASRVDIPEGYEVSLFLLHVSFCLFGYICAFFMFIMSIAYTISMVRFRKKKIDPLSSHLPPLVLQENQIDLFLALTVICLMLGLLFGFVWIGELDRFGGEMFLKITVSSLGLLVFSSLGYLRFKSRISFKGNAYLAGVGLTLLLASLMIGRHGL